MAQVKRLYAAASLAVRIFLYMTGKSGNLSWTAKGTDHPVESTMWVSVSDLTSIGLWIKVGFLDRQNFVVSISGMMRSHDTRNSWPFRLCKTLSFFDGIWGVLGVDKSNGDVPSISFPTKTGETTIVQRNEEKQKVQTFLCWGFAGVNILGACAPKTFATKIQTIWGVICGPPTLPEINFQHLKMDGWKTRGYVSFRQCNFETYLKWRASGQSCAVTNWHLCFQNHYMLTKFVLTPNNHRQKVQRVRVEEDGISVSQNCFQLPNRNASKSLQQSPTKTTLRGTNISELGKRKIINSKVFWEVICSFSGRVTGNHHSFQYHNVKNQRFRPYQPSFFSGANC